MKKLIPVMMLLALGLSSCAVKTVSRTELLSPTLSSVVNPSGYVDDLKDMKYFGSDTEYDYFMRGYSRYRVQKSENCLPEASRFTFDNWQTSKLYTECLKTSVGSSLKNKLQELLNGATANGTTAQTLPTPSTTTPAYQPKTQTGQVIQGILQQYKANKANQQ